MHYSELDVVESLFALWPFIETWSKTYGLLVRLTPPPGCEPTACVRPTTPSWTRWRDILPRLTVPGQLITMPASRVTRRFDWWPVAERLAANFGAERLAGDLPPSRD